MTTRSLQRPMCASTVLTHDASASWSGSPYFVRLGARLPWHKRQKSGTLLSDNMKQHLDKSLASYKSLMNIWVCLICIASCLFHGVGKKTLHMTLPRNAKVAWKKVINPTPKRRAEPPGVEPQTEPTAKAKAKADSISNIFEWCLVLTLLTTRVLYSLNKCPMTCRLNQRNLQLRSQSLPPGDLGSELFWHTVESWWCLHTFGVCVCVHYMACYRRLSKSTQLAAGSQGFSFQKKQPVSSVLNSSCVK